MLKTIIALLSSCVLFSGALFAQEAAQVKEDAPDRYVVVKGDTLWAISGKFLNDPWRWPDIWKLNKDEIKNPHLIYPGDVVVLDRVNGQLRLVKNEKYQGRGFEKRSPQTRIESTDQKAIPIISPADIGPFLSQPLVIEKDGLESAPRILASEENRVAIGAGNRAYVDKLVPGGPKQWHIFRPGKALVDPDTQAILGYEAIYLGDARVLKYGETTTIEIIKSVQEILRDDRLVAAANVDLANIVPHAPGPIRGRIISAYGGVSETGRGSIVTLNRGARDGLETGHVLAINRFGQEVTLPKKDKAAPPLRSITRKECLRADAKVTFNEAYDPKRAWGPCPEIDEPKSFSETYVDKGDPKLKLPEERYGLALVFRTFDKVSYALVMQSSLAVHVNDVVEKP